MPYLTTKHKLDIITRISQGQTVRQISIETRINRNTINKYINRYFGINPIIIKKYKNTKELKNIIKEDLINYNNKQM